MRLQNEVIQRSAALEAAQAEKRILLDRVEHMEHAALQDKYLSREQILEARNERQLAINQKRQELMIQQAKHNAALVEREVVSELSKLCLAVPCCVLSNFVCN